MHRFLVILCGLIMAVAFPVLASAQSTHDGNSKVAEFHLSQPLIVGTTTLKPGDYKFQCQFIDGAHYMIVKNDDGKEVARVPCTPEELGKKVDMAEFRSVTKADGSRELSSVRFKGELISHRIATPATS